MEQMTMFNMAPPYKYIMDSSTIFSQNDDNKYPRSILNSQWLEIDKLIQDKIIEICSEIWEEIKDEDIKKRLKELGCVILEIDEEIQRIVENILENHPDIVDFNKNKSSADVFIIATAKKYKLTVITEESKESYKKIPSVCNAQKVNCTDFLGLCKIQGWSF